MSSIEKAMQKLRGSASDKKPVSAAEDIFDPAIGELSNNAPASGGTITQNSIVINLDSLKERGMITPDIPSSPIAEEYRNIKRHLLKNAFGEISAHDINNLVMVTSALPGEGKTFTAMNLAISIAMERDRTVLLVDADVSRAGVGKTLELESDVLGLSDYLLNDSLSLSEILIKTNIPKLTVLAAGNRHYNMTELFSSENMKRLAGDLANRYPDRIILFDAPPLIATSEARVLTGLMGQILMVVEANKTPQAAVQEALAFIDKTKTVGLVLNKSYKPMGAAYGYGYGYGYAPKT